MQMSQLCTARLELTQGNRWSRLVRFQSFWGQQVILWVPLLLSAEKPLADCLDRMKKLWSCPSFFAFMQACLGSLCTRHLGLGRKVNVCYPLKGAQPCCAGPLLAAEGTPGPQHQPVPPGLGRQAVPLAKAASKERRGSSAWSAVLLGSRLSGAAESMLGGKQITAQAGLWQRCQGPVYCSFAQVVWGSTGSIRMLCDPSSTPHHTPWGWIKY